MTTRNAIVFSIMLALLAGAAARVSAQSWAPTGGMYATRGFAASAVLADGNTVLVTGGWDGDTTVFATADVFNPTTGTWTPVQPMTTARMRHTATLLNDGTGRVLVTGGCSTAVCNTSMNTAEIYDPATNTWTTVPPMNTARMFHTATLLPTSGHVLVTGGCVDSGCLSGLTASVTNSTQEYDPVANMWVAPLMMMSKRFQQSATLLSSNPDIVLVAGGGDGAVQLMSAELYSGGWTATGSMATRRRAFPATLLPDGTVLVAGGFDGVALNGAERFDPSGMWASAGVMTTPRDTARAVLLQNGLVLVAGGYFSKPLASAELFDYTTTTWTPTASMIAGRYVQNLEILGDGRVLAAGAWLVSGYARMSAEIYSPGKSGK